MTRLLIGLTGGLYTFDLNASDGPGPVLPASSRLHSLWARASLRECIALPTTGDFGAGKMRVRRGCASDPRRASLNRTVRF
jgi:hypothetical protein